MKKLIGIYDNTGVMIQKRPISVFPVYTDGKNFFLKCMSENLSNLLKILNLYIQSLLSPFKLY